jgi:hypothetical protein
MWQFWVQCSLLLLPVEKISDLRLKSKPETWTQSSAVVQFEQLLKNSPGSSKAAGTPQPCQGGSSSLDQSLRAQAICSSILPQFPYWAAALLQHILPSKTAPSQLPLIELKSIDARTSAETLHIILFTMGLNSRQVTLAVMVLGPQALHPLASPLPRNQPKSKSAQMLSSGCRCVQSEAAQLCLWLPISN